MKDLSTVLLQMSILKCLKKVRERERDEGPVLAEDRGSKNGTLSEERENYEDDETQLQLALEEDRDRGSWNRTLSEERMREKEHDGTRIQSSEMRSSQVN